MLNREKPIYRSVDWSKSKEEKPFQSLHREKQGEKNSQIVMENNLDLKLLDDVDDTRVRKSILSKKADFKHDPEEDKVFYSRRNSISITVPTAKNS